MGYSNDQFQGDTSPWASVWDALSPIPTEKEDQHEGLVSLLERKHLSTGDLVRVGGRMSSSTVLALAYPDGFKFRDLISGRQWTAPGSDFIAQPKIVVGRVDSTRCVVVEGDTDAARLSGQDGPGFDVLVMGGATMPPDAWLPTLDRYEWVYIATDADEAGDRAAGVWERALEKKPVRWRPREVDWCAQEAIGDPPPLPVPPPLWATLPQLRELDYPDTVSYLDQALLPESGLLMVHGWTGQFKSWLTFDLALALATGGRWAEFETTLPELKVGIVQFELPPPYYKERMIALENALPEHQRSLSSNLLTYKPFDWIDFDSKSPKYLDLFVEHVLKAGIKVLLFDPLRQMVGSEHHGDQEVQGRLVKFFRRLQGEGVAVVFTHHDGKTAARSGGGSLFDASHADALGGACDTVVSVGLPPGDRWDESPRRNLYFSKVRHAAPPGPRGFEIDGAMLRYQAEPFMKGDEDVTDAPSV